MNKKIKIVLLLLILILVVLIIKSTYSKYTAESEGAIEKDIAQWVIKVNDTDITIPKLDTGNSTNTNTTNTINNTNTSNTNTSESDTTQKKGVTFYITNNDLVWKNSGVAEGKIAPGTKGYFYLRIDPRKNQTAFMYTITIDISKILKKHINFKIANISEEKGKNLSISKLSEKAVQIQRVDLLSDDLPIDDEQRIDKIKVELEWVDDEKFNDFDTMIGQVEKNTLEIPVTVDVVQYIGQDKVNP